MKNSQNLIINNIKHLIQKNKIKSVTELAKNIGIHQPTLHRLLSGDVKEPKYINLKQISDFFKITVVDLTEKDLQIEHPTTEAGVEKSSVDLIFKIVPIVGSAQLGDGGFWSDLQYPVGHGDGHIKWPTQDPDAYALRCIGTSMMPRIKSGEFVIVEPNNTYSAGDEVLVVTINDEVMVKTFLYNRDGYINLVSVNEDHPPIHLEVAQVVKIHYVAGIAKPSLCFP